MTINQVIGKTVCGGVLEEESHIAFMNGGRVDGASGTRAEGQPPLVGDLLAEVSHLCKLQIEVGKGGLIEVQDVGGIRGTASPDDDISCEVGDGA